MTVEIENSGITHIDFYRKVVALTEQLAPDHREFLSGDNDIPTDIEELYERVLEYIGDELTDEPGYEEGRWERVWPSEGTDYIEPFQIAFYEGCLNYYVKGEPSLWEGEINPTEADLYLAFVDRGISTPYTAGIPSHTL